MPTLAPHDDTAARETSVALRLVRVVLLMAGITAAVVVVAVANGGISFPGLGNGSRAQADSAAALVAQRDTGNRQWAAATCANILDWKDEIERDGTKLDLGLGPPARLEDAIAATDRLLNELDERGLPPAAQNAQARAEIEQLRSDIESRVHAVASTASSVASGNLLSIGTLIGDLAHDGVAGTQIVSDLRHVISVDLGLSLIETRACRKLVGIQV